MKETIFVIKCKKNKRTIARRFDYNLDDNNFERTKKLYLIKLKQLKEKFPNDYIELIIIR